MNEFLLKACQNGDLIGVKQLIKPSYGNQILAQVNYKGLNGWTSLHYAVYYGNQEIAEFLITHGADFDSQTDLKVSPLIVAVQQGYQKLTELLINMGTDINISDHLDKTAIFYAIQSHEKKIVEIFLKKQSLNVNAKNNENKTIFEIETSPEIRYILDEYQKKNKSSLKGMNENKVKIHLANLNQVDEMFKNYSINFKSHLHHSF